MGEVVETISEHRIWPAAPIVFVIVVAFQFVSRWLEQLKKRGPKSAAETRLRGEIKELLKEASSLSQPSTFSQAAKLRRMAAAKEKELANYQQLHGNEIKLSYDLYLKVLNMTKVLTYLVLVCWFWRVPVASISQQLVQPFTCGFGCLLIYQQKKKEKGDAISIHKNRPRKVISWRAGGVLNGNVMVGIIPWLILSTRVSKFVCRLFKF